MAKKLLQIVLPEVIFNKIKKEHYYKVLKSFNIERESDLLIIKEFVAEGDFVIDIGANIGVYTKFLSEFVGVSGIVISIEPIPITYSFLLNDIKRMKLNNVKPYNIAIGENKSISEMFIPVGVNGKNYYRATMFNTENKEFKKGIEKIEVNLIPLDMLVNSLIRPISFIKIDVEGFELSVLKGAIKTLKKNKPSLLIEIDGNPAAIGTNADDVLKFLRELNYEPYIFINGKLNRWKAGDLSVNYFFFNENHKQLLIDKGIIS